MSTPGDHLIERVAHAMTRGEPSPRLRAGVRSRIDDQAWPRTPVIWASALASLTVLVVAVVVSREPWTSSPRISPARLVQATPSPPVSIEPHGRDRAVVDAAAAAGRRTSVRRRERPDRLQRFERPEGPGAAAPLLDPLVIEPLPVPALIAIDSSRNVMPIEIHPLQIEPLQLR